MRKMEWPRLFRLVVASLTLTGCTTVTTTAGTTAVPRPGSPGLPLLTPAVKAALPKAFIPASGVIKGPLTGSGGLDLTNLRDRFFSGAGPTDLYHLMSLVDAQLATIDGLTAIPLCLDQTPVTYAVAPLGEDVTLLGQCEMPITDGTPEGGFLQVGRDATATYIYLKAGEARLVAITHTAATGATQPAVELWFGVGYANVTACHTGISGTFDDCSYGVGHLRANAAANHVELAVAGLAMGFCGAQLVANGTSVYATGSEDTGTTCSAVGSACLGSVDLASPGTCDALTFALTPLGRHATTGALVWGASTYPTTPNVTLDGTATDTLHFGPTTPTPGLGSF